METTNFGMHGTSHGGLPWQETNGFMSDSSSVSLRESADLSMHWNQSNQQSGYMNGAGQSSQMTQLSSLLGRLIQALSQFLGVGNGYAGNNGSQAQTGSPADAQTGNQTCSQTGSQTDSQTGSATDASSASDCHCHCGTARHDERDSLSLTQTLTARFRRSCHSAQQTTTSASTSSDGKTASMATDRYKVDVAKSGWSVSVTDKETGKVQTYTGDPHAKDADGNVINFKRGLSVKMADGNILNIETSDANGNPVPADYDGVTYSNKVTLGNARDGFAEISNIAGPSALKAEKLPFGRTTPSTNFHGSVIELDSSGDFVNPVNKKKLTQAYMDEMDKMNKMLFG